MKALADYNRKASEMTPEQKLFRIQNIILSRLAPEIAIALIAILVSSPVDHKHITSCPSSPSESPPSQPA